MRVPDEAAAGQAKVTLSYDAWKEGRVLPGVFSIEVKEEKAKPR